MRPTSTHERGHLMSDMWNAIGNDQATGDIAVSTNFQTILSGEMLFEAMRGMFPPHTTGPWAQASDETRYRYGLAAERLNKQIAF